MFRKVPKTADVLDSKWSPGGGRKMWDSPHIGGSLPTQSPGAVTELLRAWSGGEDGAADVRKSRMIELWFFGGSSVETAEVLHVSPEPVKRDGRLTKLRELDGEGH